MLSPISRYPCGAIWLSAAVLIAVLWNTARAPGQPSSCPAQTVTLLTDQRLEPILRDLLSKARREIWVGMFFFKGAGHPDSIPARLLREMIAAHRRGVAVTVLLERPEDAASELAVQNARTASLLRKAGVRVYMDAPDRRSHMKVIVIDDRFLIVGSHNLTQSALKYNHELSILLDSPCLADRAVSYLKGIVQGAR